MIAPGKRSIPLHALRFSADLPKPGAGRRSQGALLYPVDVLARTGDVA